MLTRQGKGPPKGASPSKSRAYRGVDSHDRGLDGVSTVNSFPPYAEADLRGIGASAFCMVDGSRVPQTAQGGKRAKRGQPTDGRIRKGIKPIDTRID